MQKTVIFLSILLLLGFAGEMDFKDKQKEAQAYCEGVKLGEHPDYNGTYDKYCE